MVILAHLPEPYQYSICQK